LGVFAANGVYGRDGLLASAYAASLPSALPGISPSREEIDPRRGFAHLNV